MPEPALIVLEDGAVFAGEALAGAGSAGGELVFNTSMTGYQEIATDPSYAGQLIVYTFPMNGNYGCDPQRDESDQAQARAIVAREITNYRFNHDSSSTWLDWLNEHNVLAVSGVDTRALTRHIRDQGALRAVVSTETDDIAALRKAAQRLPRMAGLDLSKSVSCSASYTSPATAADLSTFIGQRVPTLNVVAYDFGIKRSMIRYLNEQNFNVTVVPAGTSAREVLRLAPDGVFLSNGPGDPAAVTYAVKTVNRLLGKVPIFGICLGHQLLALALGMSTYKLKFGHRGANHPVKDLRTGIVEITTQNHGFAVRDEGGARDGTEVTHINLDDQTVEGLACRSLFAFSVQYHPESTPGPHDSLYLFERFRTEIARYKERG
jgi:carbamoyl-phosphate synthase small subunit